MTRNTSIQKIFKNKSGIHKMYLKLLQMTDFTYWLVCRFSRQCKSSKVSHVTFNLFLSILLCCPSSPTVTCYFMNHYFQVMSFSKSFTNL